MERKREKKSNHVQCINITATTISAPFFSFLSAPAAPLFHYCIITSVSQIDTMDISLKTCSRTFDKGKSTRGRTRAWAR